MARVYSHIFFASHRLDKSILPASGNCHQTICFWGSFTHYSTSFIISSDISNCEFYPQNTKTKDPAIFQRTPISKTWSSVFLRAPPTSCPTKWRPIRRGLRRPVVPPKNRQQIANQQNRRVKHVPTNVNTGDPKNVHEFSNLGVGCSTAAPRLHPLSVRGAKSNGAKTRTTKTTAIDS